MSDPMGGVMANDPTRATPTASAIRNEVCTRIVPSIGEPAPATWARRVDDLAQRLADALARLATAEAADEIERLRASLAKLMEAARDLAFCAEHTTPGSKTLDECASVVRAVLVEIEEKP